jgi:TatD DNase family protein
VTRSDAPGGVPTQWSPPTDWAPVPLPDPLPSPVIDAHTHLDAVGCQTIEDVDAVLQSAASVGVVGAITVGDDLASNRWAAAAAAEHPRLWAAIGIHPTRADSLDDDARAEIAELARRRDVVAVGETGLDYYWDAAARSTQREAFGWHIALAKTVGKPLVVHDRLAHDDVLTVLRAEGAPDTVVFHCFSGDLAIARQCLDAGYLLSFAGPLTFKNARELQDVARMVPVDRILVETDAPFLAPHPHRGRKNHPAAVAYTLRTLADLRKTDIEALAASVTTTTKAAFGIG